MEKKMISIIVPAYKNTFLAQCVESVLAQTYAAWQLVVVNDASPYDLDSIMGRYTDARVRYIKREQGLGAEHLVDNWNECLSYVEGEYVICMGDDDMLDEHCLEAYVALTKKYPDVDVFHAWTAIIDERSEKKEVGRKHAERESVYSFMQSVWSGDRLFIGDVMMRTSTLRQIGGYHAFPYAWHADHLTTFAVAKAHGVANMQRVGFYYRENGDSITCNSTHAYPKVVADHQAKLWYADFLAEEPQNGVDKVIRLSMQRELQRWYEKTVAYDIAVGIRRKPLNLLAWLPRKRNVELNRRIFFRALLLSLYI